MKKLFKRLAVMVTLVAALFFTTSCLGGGVSGKTYEVISAEVKSNSFSQDELDVMSSRLEGDIGETIVFAEDGTFGDEGTLKSINGLTRLVKWSQSGDTITINEGSNIYPTKAYIDGDNVVIEVGNINGWLFVYTFAEVAA